MLFKFLSISYFLAVIIIANDIEQNSAHNSIMETISKWQVFLIIKCQLPISLLSLVHTMVMFVSLHHLPL